MHGWRDDPAHVLLLHSVNRISHNGLPGQRNAGLAEKNLKVIYNVLCVGGGSLVTKLFATILVGTHKARAAAEWRKAYMRAILLQDVGWYDISNSQTLSTAFGEALTNVEAGLGSQVWGQGPLNIGNIVAGFAIGLSSEWATAALAIVFVPYSLYGIWLMGKTQKSRRGSSPRCMQSRAPSRRRRSRRSRPWHTSTSRA